MYRFVQVVFAALSVVALALGSASVPSAAAGGLISLSHLAPALGYTYVWLASGSAAALTRPGLYVLVRSGNQLYDVNDSVETTPQAPQFRNNDIFVGAGLVARLRSLAAAYPAPVPRVKPPAGTPLSMSGPRSGFLTVAVAPTDVSDAVVVSGSGPADVPLTITLSADISRDLPRLLLSRTNIQIGADGRYAVKISTTPLHFEKAVVQISAASLPGITEAHTSFVLGPPSPKIEHPVDELPRDFKPHL